MWRWVSLTVLAGWLGAACADPAPLVRPRLKGPVFSTVSPANDVILGTATLEPPPNSVNGVPAYSTGIPLPAGVAVRVTVNGKMDFTKNPAWLTCFGQVYPPLSLMSVGPWGFPPAGDFGVQVGEGTAAGIQPGAFRSLSPADGTSDTAGVDLVGSGGVLWVQRSGVSETCGPNTPAYLVSGTQTLTVHRPASGCQLNVPYESQADPRWGSTFYDNEFDLFDISRKGCALTSLSMALTYAGISSSDPLSLNGFLKDFGDFSGGNVLWGGAVRDAAFGTGLKFKGFKTTDPQALGTRLCSTGAPIVVAVNITPQGAGHFVLATGVAEDGTILINDPGHAGKKTLGDYQNQFETRGYIGDPAGPIGELDVVVDSQRLLATDGSGRRTGFDPVSGQALQGIPQSTYFVDALEDDTLTNKPGPVATASVSVFQPPDGIYQVAVEGLNPGPYALRIRTFATDGSTQAKLSIPGITDGTTTTAFQVQYGGAPGAAPVVTRIVTFGSALQDVAVALKLGLIETPGIADALTQLLDAAQRAAARGDTAASASAVDAFHSLVQAQRARLIQEPAATVLLDDAARLRASL